MSCKFHAFMSFTSPSKALVTVGLLLATALPAPSAQAERADRLKPLTIQADRDGQLDLQKQVVVFSGNVIVTKGTMTIHAARIEVRQTPAGYDNAVAFGAPSKPATFRQKREGVDEYMDGEAERLEYDGKSDVIRFINNAAVRRLRGATPADEITGNLITYDNTTDVLRVSGGAAATAANPGGRVRAVLTPREGTEAAAEVAEAASAASGLPLKSSPALGASAPAAARP
jgi:lipopolysaccharide export system protein LptA